MDTSKGFFRKLCDISDTLIKVNIDYDKIQFSSSTSRISDEFSLLRTVASENNSIFLFKYEKRKNLDTNKMWQYHWTSYFDLVLIIDNNKLKIIKSRYTTESKDFDISQAIRSHKLKKLSLLKI